MKKIIRADHASANRRLRFVFDNTAMSFSLAANATLEDVARVFARFSRRRFGNSVAIDITFAT